jgi:transposase
MMAIDSETRKKVIAELRTGKKPGDLAEKYGISYPTVAGWKRKIEEEKVDEEVDELINYDEVTLHTVVEKAKEELPTVEAKKVAKVVEEAYGLKRLDEKTRTIGVKIIDKVGAYVDSNPDMSLKELKEAASIVTMIHSAFFNKNVTQVNVVNSTSINTEKREIFKASLKA